MESLESHDNGAAPFGRNNGFVAAFKRILILTACDSLLSIRFQNCFLLHKEASGSLRIAQGNPFDFQYQDRTRTISELEGQEDFP